MKEKKLIVDTTLRDGEQSPGYAFTKEQKVFIASVLSNAGVYQIEAGIPAIGRYEKETICEIMRNKKNTKIATWNRLNISDIKDSFDCEPDIIHICVPVSYPQIYTKLRKNKAWVIKNLTSCVELALSNNYEVTVGFEDASRADYTFMIKLAVTLMEIGVRRIRFADTVGVLTPTRTYNTINGIIQNTGIEVEMHAHNDLGMAVANSIAAAKAGAKYIDTTILGIGERAGNCDFKKFVFAAELHFPISSTRLGTLTVEKETSHIIAKEYEREDVL
jgi:homocitrate synthase NifV